MSATIKFEFRLAAEYKKTSKWILASCPILDVHTQGKTKPEAKRSLIEAVTLFLESCFEMGTLDDVLKECGFCFAGVKEFREQRQGEIQETINVPLHLLPQSDNRIPCHA